MIDHLLYLLFPTVSQSSKTIYCALKLISLALSLAYQVMHHLGFLKFHFSLMSSTIIVVTTIAQAADV
jgi:hypothetical protein